jgi:hypothetical protein
MQKVYEYRTTIGPFYIVKQGDCYHAIYAGISLFRCCRADEIAAVLGYGYKFNRFGSEIGETDTFDLGIPTDLSDWTLRYFVSTNIRSNFKQNLGHKT